MDQPRVDNTEPAADLRNLAWFNRLLGGITVIRAHLPRMESGEWSVVSGEEPRGRSPLTTDHSPRAERWSVLDVATGGGDIPRWLVRRRSDRGWIMAADLHPQMLAQARRWS